MRAFLSTIHAGDETKGPWSFTNAHAKLAHAAEEEVTTVLRVAEPPTKPGWSGHATLSLECVQHTALAEALQAFVADHTKDADCTVDPETDLCVICNVLHGDHCVICGGRGYHNPGCLEIDPS